MAKKVWGDEETQFFYELTPDRILDAFEKVTNLRATGRSLALNSMENRVYDVEIEVEEDFKGPRWDRNRILKFYRPGRWSQEQILEEHQFLFDLVDNEIPVVAPLKFDGKSLFKDETTGLSFTVFPKVSGRSPHELTNEQLEQVGRLLARLHNVGASKKADHRITLTPESYGLENLAYLLDQKILPLELESRYRDVVQRICEHTAPWFEETPYQRVHGDCHLGNLLWGDQGPFWVDFDDFVTGPCVQDFWLMIPGRDEYSQNQLKKVIESYRMMRDFDGHSLRLVEPLRALRFVHFHAWISKRWKDPAFPRAFPDFNSHNYWHHQVSDLEEQWQLITGRM